MAFVMIQQTQHLSVHANSGSESSPPPNTISSQHNHNQAIFSLEQEQLFQRRYEEKYDLLDPTYQQWLMINHPTVGQVQDDQLT